LLIFQHFARKVKSNFSGVSSEWSLSEKLFDYSHHTSDFFTARDGGIGVFRSAVTVATRTIVVKQFAGRGCFPRLGKRPVRRDIA